MTIGRERPAGQAAPPGRGPAAGRVLATAPADRPSPRTMARSQSPRASSRVRRRRRPAVGRDRGGRGRSPRPALAVHRPRSAGPARAAQRSPRRRAARAPRRGPGRGRTARASMARGRQRRAGCGRGRCGRRVALPQPRPDVGADRRPAHSSAVAWSSRRRHSPRSACEDSRPAPSKMPSSISQGSNSGAGRRPSSSRT